MKRHGGTLLRHWKKSGANPTLLDNSNGERAGRFLLGYLYFTGCGGKRDRGLAKEMFDAASARSSDKQGLWPDLAPLDERGSVKPGWFYGALERAIDRGDRSAMRTLGAQLRRASNEILVEGQWREADFWLQGAPGFVVGGDAKPCPVRRSGNIGRP